MVELCNVSSESMNKEVVEFFRKQWSNSKVVGYYLKSSGFLGVPGLFYFEAWRYRGPGLALRVHTMFGIALSNFNLTRAWQDDASFRDGFDVSPCQLKPYGKDLSNIFYYNLDTGESRLVESRKLLYELFCSRFDGFGTSRSGVGYARAKTLTDPWVERQRSEIVVEEDPRMDGGSGPSPGPRDPSGSIWAD